MNEVGIFGSYHNKELEYLRVPVMREFYARIPDWFCLDHCPHYGFGKCLTPVLTCRAEVLVDAVDPWVTLEG